MLKQMRKVICSLIFATLSFVDSQASELPYKSSVESRSWSVSSSLSNYTPGFISEFFKTEPDKYDRSKFDKSCWGKLYKENKNNCLGFFCEPKAKVLQREDWYAVLPFISDFHCSWSSLVILGVGIYDQSWFTILAGLMSLASHSIPTEFTHYLDLSGVAPIVGICIYNFSDIINSPSTLYSGLFALSLLGADAILARTRGDKVGPWPHVSWHLTASNALHNLNLLLSQKS